MTEARWFLAHRRQDDDTDIDDWTARLGASLVSNSGEAVTVVAGRDDYKARASAIGGWKPWSQDVPCGCNWRGDPRFHGIVVPIDALEEAPLIGRATADLVKGFMAQRKHAFAWCPRTEQFRAISEVSETGIDDWKGWAKLTLSP